MIDITLGVIEFYIRLIHLGIIFNSHNPAVHLFTIVNICILLNW